MSSKHTDGPECSRSGSPFLPEDMDEFLKAYGVARLEDPMPVAADCAKHWFRENGFSSRIQESVCFSLLYTRFSSGSKSTAVAMSQQQVR